MVNTADRSLVGDHPRDAVDDEWEVFVREETDEPLFHVGSVTASDADSAHDHASRLFGWHASDVWVCPSTEMARYSTHELDDEARREGDDEATPAASDEAQRGRPDP